MAYGESIFCICVTMADELPNSLMTLLIISTAFDVSSIVKENLCSSVNVLVMILLLLFLSTN